MLGKNGSRSAVLQWVVVLVVGGLVVTFVLALNLIPRLNDGQKVLDAARPAFAAQRLTGARAGIDSLSKDVDMADAIVNPRARAADEVPQLILFLSKESHVSQEEIVAALQERFPHTLALLQAIPLSSITDEQPALLAFLEKSLNMSRAELLASLKTNFPALTQAIVNLPTVTNGWDNIPNIDALTRFDGTPVQSVPQLRTYVSADLIPILETQQGNFGSLDGNSTLNWIAPLLLVVGLLVVLLAAVMIALNIMGCVSRSLATAGAAVVLGVGVGVVALVLVISLVPRTLNGQKLLDALRPVNTAERVYGDRVGINLVSAFVDAEDAIMTPQGGAAAEVPKLIAFVSQETGLSQAAVLAALQKNVPHTTALLQTIPLSSVTAELPGLFAFLRQQTGLSQADLLAALQKSFPALTQAITNLPGVTNGWNDVPKMDGATNFAGTQITTVPNVRTYFGSDLVPVLETQRGNYEHLMSTSTIDFIGPLVLALGIIVILYGTLMLFLARRLQPNQSRVARAPSSADPAATSA